MMKERFKCLSIIMIIVVIAKMCKLRKSSKMVIDASGFRQGSVKEAI